MNMREMLTNAVTKYTARAEQEAARPYDGCGETPEQIAAWWREQAEKAESLLRTLR